MRRPDLFLVGAPRCGTTALYSYLRTHPDVFMSPLKEPFYFCPDLRFGQTRPPTFDEYGRLFAGARQARRVGEATTFYLYSRRAASLIREFSPQARILIMLREPTEVMQSLHALNLYLAAEDVPDFGAALALEDERRQGRHVPRGAQTVDQLLYRAVVRYPEQVERYLDVFGRPRVHVILYDEFRRDPATAYRDVLRFLEVPPDGRQAFPVVNARRQARSQALRRLQVYPPEPVRRLVRAVAGPVVRRFIVRKLGELSSRPGGPATPDPGLLRALRAEMAPEVERLGALLGRDLGHWTRA